MYQYLFVALMSVVSFPCFGSSESSFFGRSFSFVMEVQSSHLKIPAFTYRFFEDDHLQKFISKNKGLKDPLYEPTDLVPLQSSQFLSIQGNRSLRTQANEHLIQLSQAFYEQFQKPIVVISAYRSYTYQKYQISESCKQSGYCAKEGESEHQLGLAVDLREATNEEKFLLNYQNYYDWLKDHAHVYGFHQSYQHGKDSDGYAIEPRHWRYLGVDLATILYKKNITFAEYVGYNTVQKK